jgi:hypothetical protein
MTSISFFRTRSQEITFEISGVARYFFGARDNQQTCPLVTEITNIKKFQLVIAFPCLIIECRKSDVFV